MQYNEILNLDISNKNILIIGLAGTGKSTLANRLVDNTHTLVHTDDFKGLNFEEQLYLLTAYIDYNKSKYFLIEGILGYYLLLKSIEYPEYTPDIVIELKATEKQLIEVYRKRKKNVQQVLNLNKSLLKVYYRYIKEVKDKPIFLTINNKYTNGKL
jgi:GTPase SAR1 family protein